MAQSRHGFGDHNMHDIVCGPRCGLLVVVRWVIACGVFGRNVVCQFGRVDVDLRGGDRVVARRRHKALAVIAFS